MNARIGFSETDQIRPWLNGFVTWIGEAEAERLLEGVGKLEDLPNQDTTLEDNQKEGAEDRNEAFQTGDIVQANYKGDGYWLWAEVATVHSNGYYNIFYAEDCTEEIATPGSRLRRSGKADDSKDYAFDIKSLAKTGEKVVGKPIAVQL